MKITHIILLVVLYGMQTANAQEHYKIYDTKKSTMITVDDIIKDMHSTDVLFFGEEHNDSIAHVLEYTLLKKLNEQYPQKAALSMEMFETDCQLVLNEYLSGLIREKNFITDARAWKNYKDYRPLIEYAREQHMPVVAANAPARYTNMVNRNGLESLNKLDASAKKWLPPLPIDTATGRYYDKFAEIMGGHGSMNGMQLYQAQNLWDATMGWSIATFLKNHKEFKILQVNGGFHSEEKLGAAAQLMHYDKKARVLNIALYSDADYDHPDWSKLSKMADYIIVTDPKLPRSY